MDYKIGKIVNTHGIKGELVIRSLTDFSRFEVGKEIFAFLNNEKVNFKIKKVKETNKGLIISFNDFNNINEVLKYKNLELFTNEKPLLDEDEYHFNDLINKKVYNTNNNYIGIIVEVVEVPQGHILRVKIDDYTKLIPFNEAFVKSVDEVVVIEEIEGLL